MASLYQTQGTDITWKASDGTHVLTLTNLANNTGRKGDVHDFGANFPFVIRVSLLTKFAVAPTSGKTIDVWWASSADNSNFAGPLSAGDAAQNDFGVVNNLKLIGSLPLLAITASQSKTWDLAITARYGFPVVMNNASGQSLTSTATDHIFTLTPIIYLTA